MSDKKPNGRPRKRPENQRTNVEHYRTTEQESAQIAADAAAMNLSKADYFRHRMGLGKTGSRKANPERAMVIKAIATIGHVCQDLRKSTNHNTEKEFWRLNSAIKIKLDRFPRKDDPTLYDSLRKLSDQLSGHFSGQKDENREELLKVLENLSNNLMSFLNGNKR